MDYLSYGYALAITFGGIIGYVKAGKLSVVCPSMAELCKSNFELSVHTANALFIYLFIINLVHIGHIKLGRNTKNKR